jgi:hypothetical protein
LDQNLKADPDGQLVRSVFIKRVNLFNSQYLLAIDYFEERYDEGKNKLYHKFFNISFLYKVYGGKLCLMLISQEKKRLHF